MNETGLKYIMKIAISTRPQHSSPDDVSLLQLLRTGIWIHARESRMDEIEDISCSFLVSAIYCYKTN